MGNQSRNRSLSECLLNKVLGIACYEYAPSKSDALRSDKNRGVDPYGSGGTRPPNIWTGGHYRECPPQYFYSNISYFLSMQ